MTHQEKIDWMIMWAHRNKCVLDLEGECGIGRQCVGITRNHTYPDYTYDVWTPEDAYHNHPCVAVLGRGERAEEQLYQWLKWFDDNGFVIEEDYKDPTGMDPIQIMFSGVTDVRMVKAKLKEKST